MKKVIIILIVSLITVNSWSQNAELNQKSINDSISVQSLKGNSDYDIGKNSVYLEFLGNGILSSFNYDRRIRLNESNGLILRAGLGFYGEKKLIEGSYPEEQKFQSELSPIFELNYTFGTRKHFLELGVGNNNFRSLSFRAGYRLQKESGFLLRAGIVIITKDEWWVPVWPGFSFGYSF